MFADELSRSAYSSAGLARTIEVETIAAARVRRSLKTLDGDVIVVDGRITRVADFIKQIRAAHSTRPILLIASRADDVPAAAAAGANDFALAGASAAEVSLRIHMLSSAAVRPLSSMRRVGPLVLDRGARSLSCLDASVRLSPNELALFERLLLEPGRPVSRADLERSIWGQTEPGELATNIAVVYVSYLRKKLAQLGGACRIVTHTNVGYALELQAASAPRRPSSREARVS